MHYIKLLRCLRFVESNNFEQCCKNMLKLANVIFVRLVSAYECIYTRNIAYLTSRCGRVVKAID